MCVRKNVYLWRSYGHTQTILIHERSIILKYMKTKKVWYQLIFIAAIVTSGFGSLEVWAAEQSGYTGCSSSILKMVTVRNQFRDLLRNIEFNILSFLADRLF